MPDIKNPKLLYIKAAVFLLSGLLAGAGVVLEHPTLKTTILLVVAIWCFCRAYYFAFYVIERYVDPAFKFAGLGAFAKYLITKRPP